MMICHGWYPTFNPAKRPASLSREIVTEVLRVLGGYGYSAEYTIERLYRDAPFLLIGEGTSEIQKQVIARRLLEKYKI